MSSMLLAHDPWFDCELANYGGLRVVGNVTGTVTVANPFVWDGSVAVSSMPDVNINIPSNGLPIDCGSTGDLAFVEGTNYDFTGASVYDEEESTGEFGTRRAQGVDISKVDFLSFDRISATGGRKGSEIVQSALSFVGGGAFGGESATTDMSRVTDMGVSRFGEVGNLVTNGTVQGSWTFNGKTGAGTWAHYTNGFSGIMVTTSPVPSIAKFVSQTYSPIYDQMEAFEPMLGIGVIGNETGLVGYLGGIKYLPSRDLCLTSASVSAGTSWLRSFISWASAFVLALLISRRVCLVLVGIGVI